MSDVPALTAGRTSWWPAIRRITRHGEILRVIGAALAVGAALMWMGDDLLHRDMAVVALTYLFIALGIYLPYALAGSLSIAYPAYINIGAYTVALMSLHTGWSLVWAFPIAFVISGIVAALLGLLTARLTGFYLAAVTLLFAEAFANLLAHSSTFGGAVGISDVRSLSMFGFEFDDTQFVVVSIVAAALCTLALSRIRRSSFGLTLRGQREIPAAVGATGVVTPGMTLTTLAIGAGISSFAGCIFALANHAIFPESLTLDLVIVIFFIPMLGGRDTPWGCVAGTILVVGLTLGVGVSSAVGSFIFAAAVLVILIVFPRGVFGLLQVVGRATLNVSRRIVR